MKLEMQQREKQHGGLQDFRCLLSGCEKNCVEGVALRLVYARLCKEDAIVYFVAGLIVLPQSQASVPTQL